MPFMLGAMPSIGKMSAETLQRNALNKRYEARMLAGKGNKYMNAFNAAQSFQNALWSRAIAKRNSKIAENNARRVEQHTAFVVAGMKKQVEETEKLQRRQKAELGAKLNMARGMGGGTKSADFMMAKLAQAEHNIQLHRIAGENKIRERKFSGASRAYDIRLGGANQRIAGARKTQAQLMKTGMFAHQAFDNSYKEAAKIELDMGMQAIDVLHSAPTQLGNATGLDPNYQFAEPSGSQSNFLAFTNTGSIPVSK
jgi:hypothetical protein